MMRAQRETDYWGQITEEPVRLEQEEGHSRPARGRGATQASRNTTWIFGSRERFLFADWRTGGQWRKGKEKRPEEEMKATVRLKRGPQV